MKAAGSIFGAYNGSAFNNCVLTYNYINVRSAVSALSTGLGAIHPARGFDSVYDGF